MTERRLREMLMKHEGLRLKPYKCSAGRTTIGWGRNLDDEGISEFEANLMLSNDIARVLKECVDAFPWFNYLSVVRQDVIADMIYNLGLPRFKEFKKLIEALRSQNYALAASEMLASKWAEQVGQRALDLAQMMRTGNYLS